MAFAKFGVSSVIGNVEPAPEVKAEVVEEKCDCNLNVEKKEITTKE